MKLFLLIQFLFLTAHYSCGQFDLKSYQEKLTPNATDSIMNLYWNELRKIDQNEITNNYSDNYDSVMQLNLIKVNILLNKYGINSLGINNITPITIYIHNRIPTTVIRSWKMIEKCYNSVNEQRIKKQLSKTHDKQYLLDGLFLTVYDKSVLFDNIDSLLSVADKNILKKYPNSFTITDYENDYEKIKNQRKLKNIEIIGTWERVQLKGLKSNGNFTIVKKSDGNYYQEIIEGGIVYPKKLILKDKSFIFEDDFMNWKLVLTKNGNLELHNEIETKLLIYQRINN